MKVYEIILEERQLDELSINPLNWFKSDKSGGSSAASKGAVAKLEKDAARLGLVTGGREAAKTTWLAKVGKWGALKTFIYAVGFVAIAVELNYYLDVVNARYKNNELTSDQWKQQRDYYIGIWMVEMLVPFVISFLQRAKFITFFATAITAFATISSGGVLIPVLAGLLATFGSEALLFAGIEAFLHSNMAQDYMVKWFKELAMIGKIGDDLWQELYTLVTGKNFDTVKKQELNPAAAKKDQDDAENQKMLQAKAEKNAVYINGINVTDKDGYLDDTAVMRDPVQYAIRFHPEDPGVQKLASLPRRPGALH